MLVSVAVPTFGREEFLPALHASFEQQSYPDLELLVLDDSPEPSPFFSALRSDRVRYLHDPVRTSIGSKRNRLLELARGEVVVQFDDDDRYAPSYVAAIVDRLADADLFTYDGWYLQRVIDGSLWFWDTTRIDDPHFVVHGQAAPLQIIGLAGQLKTEADRRNFNEANQWGYGFSYAYRREPALRARFPSIDKGEDFGLVQSLRQLGAKLRSAPDIDGQVLHLLHPGSTSRCFPQYRLAPAQMALLASAR